MFGLAFTSSTLKNVHSCKTRHIWNLNVPISAYFQSLVPQNEYRPWKNVGRRVPSVVPWRLEYPEKDLEPKWPLFLKVNPSKQGRTSNQNKGPHWVLGIYIYNYIIYNLKQLMKNTQLPTPKSQIFAKKTPRNHRAVSFQSTESAACGFDFLHLHQLTLDIATILSLATRFLRKGNTPLSTQIWKHDLGAEMILKKKNEKKHICLFWWWSRKVATCGNYDSLGNCQTDYIHFITASKSIQSSYIEDFSKTSETNGETKPEQFFQGIWSIIHQHQPSPLSGLSRLVVHLLILTTVVCLGSTNIHHQTKYTGRSPWLHHYLSNSIPSHPPPPKKKNWENAKKKKNPRIFWWFNRPHLVIKNQVSPPQCASPKLCTRPSVISTAKALQPNTTEATEDGCSALGIYPPWAASPQTVIFPSLRTKAKTLISKTLRFGSKETHGIFFGPKGFICLMVICRGVFVKSYHYSICNNFWGIVEYILYQHCPKKWFTLKNTDVTSTSRSDL